MDARGTSVRGTVLASCEEDAKWLLSSRGLVMTRLSSARASKPNFTFRAIFALLDRRRAPRLSTVQIQRLVFALLQPLKVGLTISDAIRLSIDQADRGGTSRPLLLIQDRIQQGDTLHDAFAISIPDFPLDALALIEAGERSGQLASVFHMLNDRLARAVAIHNEVRAALVYPTLVLVVGLLVVAILFASVIPTISEMISDKREYLSISAASILALSDFVHGNWPTICLAVFTFVLLLIASLKSVALAHSRQRLLMRLPLLGLLMIRKDAAQFTRALSAQIGGGVALGRAVEQSVSGIALEPLRARAQGIAQKLSQGWALSDAIFKDLPQFPREIAGFAKIGEQTGRLTEMLEHASEAVDARVRDQARLLSSLVTPVVTIVLGLLVGGVVLALMSAILSLNDVALR